jgi:cephalosporin hydroxylase
LQIKIVDDHGAQVDPYSKDGMKALVELWTKVARHHRVMYEPSWLGIPIIQYAEDVLMMQELIWKLRPDVIVETGIAHGGSAVLYASILELIGHGRVIGVDVEIRKYNRVAIMSHAMSHRIEMVEGSSVDPAVVRQVAEKVRGAQQVLVTLDSNHSYEHVKKEIAAYAPLVSSKSYLVVMDGAQKLMAGLPDGKPEWEHDNPLRAIDEFLAAHPEWETDLHYNRMHVTSSPRGFLRRRAAA